MLQTTTNLIQQSVDRLKLGQDIYNKLITPDRVIEFEIKLNNGKKFKAYRSQHNNLNGPYKGGIRFHPDINKAEVTALSILMSLKTALVDLPLGGGKGGIAVDPKSLTETELEELSRLYARHLADKIGPTIDIPAPDVNTNPKVIGWMVNEYQKITNDKTRASFTGKSIADGGSAGRDEATGRGGFIVTSEILKLDNIIEPTYAVQGYGNVGMYFALTAQELAPDWFFNMASDSKSAIKAKVSSIDALKLAKYKASKHTLKCFDNNIDIKSEDLLYSPNTVLALAALGGVVTRANANNIDCMYIVELANGPVSDNALTILNQNKIQVIPDILANAGGVIVSYYEWYQNMHNQTWDIDTVNQKLKDTLIKTTKEVVDYRNNNKLTLKQSALDLSILKLSAKMY
jgi:glutamate dehydrogenase/leucine dehydrogenase